MLEVTAHIKIPLDEFQFTFSRSGGPGGQNVNKVNTKATLHWDVRQSPSLPDAVRSRFISRYATRISGDGQLVLSSQRYRDQARNRQDCLDKLRRLVESVARAPKRRRPTRPTRASRERRLKAKQRTAEKKRLRRQPPSAD